MMIEVSKLRLDLTGIINQAAFAGTPCIVTKNGHEVVAIISIKDFKKLEALKNSENLKTHPSKKIKIDKKFESISEKKFFGLKEAAHFMGVSWGWLHRRVKQGFINVVSIGGKKQITMDEIRRFQKSKSEIYSFEEVKSILGISTSFFSKLLKNGKIKASKVFGKYEIEKSEIDRILKEGTGKNKLSEENESKKS